MQYRAPEQCDLYSRQSITEKVDVWALGCVLYKLAYDKTPFEEGGSLAIVNCKYDFPQVPPYSYSQKFKDLIKLMLQPEVALRPDAFLVLEEVCKMRAIAYPLKVRTGKYKTQLDYYGLKPG